MLLDGVPNPGPGLGNLANDSAHKQLFVSDLYTGMIHRIDLNGADLGHYDHGVTARPAANLPPAPFDPAGRLNITSNRFNADNPATWGFAAPARRVWAVTIHQERLYYSVLDPLQIWSVGIAQDGSFAADARLEVDVPAQPGPFPVTDIAFAQTGAMVVAQRAAFGTHFYDYSGFTNPGEPRVLRFWLKDANDPPSPGLWKPQPEEYEVGFAGNFRNPNGGVDFAYGYDQNAVLSTGACESSLVVTGEKLRLNPQFQERLAPGGPFPVDGLQIAPVDQVRDPNTPAPPWQSYYVDYDGKFENTVRSGHLGSVRTYRTPCSPIARVGGAGAGTTPGGGGGGDCPQGRNPDGTCGPQPIDLAIEKTVGKGTYDEKTGTWTYQFTLIVTNVGNPFIAGNHIVINDPVPNGLTFTLASGTNWTCSPTPVSAPNALSCTYNFGSGQIATGAVLPPIVITATVSTAGTFENCANVGIAGAPWLQETTQSNNRSCAKITVPVDLAISKTAGERKFDEATGTWGFQYTLTVTNVGVAHNGPIQVNDSIPAGLTFTSVTAAGWACAPVTPLSSGALNCTHPGPIAHNQTFTITITVTAKTAGKYENCATVGVTPASGLTETTLENNRACITTELPVDLAIRKTAAAAGSTPGAFTFTLTVTNIGAPFAGAGAITVSDVAPAGMTFTSATGSAGLNCTLTAGTTVACTYSGAGPSGPNQVIGTVKIEATTTGAGPWENCADVGLTPASGYHDANTTDNRSCKTVKTEVGSLSVRKILTTSDVPSSTPLGNLVFPVTVTCGTNVTNGTITPNTPLTVNNLPVPGTCTVTEGAFPTLPANACPAGSTPIWLPVSTSATVIVSTGSTLTVSMHNELQCKPTQAECGLVVVKSKPADPTLDLDPQFPQGLYPGFCTPGSPCIFSVAITNTCPTPFTGEVTIADQTTAIGAGGAAGANTPMTITSVQPACNPQPTSTPFSCQATVTNLAPNQTVTYTINGMIPFGASLPITNPTTNADGSASGIFSNCLDLSVPGQLGSKACSKYESCGHTCHMWEGSTSSLAIKKEAVSATCAPGQLCSYTITVTNVGGSPSIIPISIVDTMPAGATFDHIDPPYNLPAPPAPVPGPWSCTSYNSGSAASGPNQVQCNYPPANLYPSLALQPGASTSFTIFFVLPAGASGAYKNCAEFNIKGVTPGINFRRSDLPSNSSLTRGMREYLEARGARAQPRSAAAAAAPNDDKSCATVNVQQIVVHPPADLAIAKTGGTSPAPQVNAYAFHLTVTNVGAAFNGNNAITVTDVVPAGMTFDAATGANWTCATLPVSAGGTMTCTYTGTGPTAPNQSLGTIDITATATGAAPFPPFNNCATVALLPASGRQDTNPANNTACVTVTKPQAGSLIVKKTVSGATPIPITGVEFPVTVTCGTQTTTGTVTDSKPLTVNNIPVPSTCTVKEGTPPVPANACPAGTMPIWSMPTYTPASASIGSGPAATITVHNELRCVPRIDCRPPLVPNAAGTACGCPEGMGLVGEGQRRRCIPPPKCEPPKILGSDGKICRCPEGTTERRGRCIEVPKCRLPMVMGPDRKSCRCPEGTTQRGGRCVEVPKCTPPKIPGPGGRGCVCQPGMMPRGDTCVRQVTCQPPMVLVQGPAGPSCGCPQGTERRGNTCAKSGGGRGDGRPAPRTPGLR